MGVRAKTEVYGLFAAVLPQNARTTIGQWPLRKRQGLVPDFAIALPVEGQSQSDAADELFELKTLHYGHTTYPDAAADSRGGAVIRRADGLPARAAAKARQLDAQFCGTQEGDTGPVARRLDAFGPFRGVVVGHWAEGSRHIEALLTGAAYYGS